MNFLILYCVLCFVNVVLQTVKSLCTVKCSTFVSACVNAIAYGLYTYVIFFTNAEGLSLFVKAIITAIANFTGVYLANILFNKLFSREVEWSVNVSIPQVYLYTFLDSKKQKNLLYHNYCCKIEKEYSLFTVF